MKTELVPRSWKCSLPLRKRHTILLVVGLLLVAALLLCYSIRPTDVADAPFAAKALIGVCTVSIAVSNHRLKLARRREWIIWVTENEGRVCPNCGFGLRAHALPTICPECGGYVSRAVS